MAAIPWRQIDLSTLQDLCRDCVRTETTVLQSIFSATSQRQTTSPIQDGAIKDNRYVKICKYLQQSRFCWRISPWKDLAMVIISGRKKIIFLQNPRWPEADALERPVLRYRTKFHGHHSRQCGDITIFRGFIVTCKNQQNGRAQHGITNVVKLRDK